MNPVNGWILLTTAAIILIACPIHAILRHLRTRTIIKAAEANEEWLRQRAFYPGMTVDTDIWPECQCTVYFDNDADRAVWITCGTCKPTGRHHFPADIITARRDDLERWRES